MLLITKQSDELFQNASSSSTENDLGVASQYISDISHSKIYQSNLEIYALNTLYFDFFQVKNTISRS